MIFLSNLPLGGFITISYDYLPKDHIQRSALSSYLYRIIHISYSLAYSRDLGISFGFDYSKET